MKTDFLRAICRDAADDTPRLVFADWLDEHGDADRAEFIRLQIARARDVTGDAAHPRSVERERELFELHKDEWLAELPTLEGVTWGDHFPQSSVHVNYFERGFVFSVCLRDADSLKRHSEAIAEQTTARQLCIELADRHWPKFLLGFLGSPSLARFHALKIGSYLGARFYVDGILIRFGAEGIRMLAASPYLNDLKHLDIGDQGIGDEGARLLTENHRFAGLTGLVLKGNAMTSAGLLALAHSPWLSQLTDLDLSSMANVMLDDHFARCDDGLTALVRSSNFRQLRSLSLGSTEMDDPAIAILAQGSFPLLGSLDLSANRISANGVGALARSTVLSCLRELQLAGNPLGTAGAVALIKTAPLEHLHTLDLSGTRLGPEAVFALADSPLAHRLGRLNLGGNPIGAEGLTCFRNRDAWPNLVSLSVSFRAEERPIAEELQACWGSQAYVAAAQAMDSW